jgi:hypothetical protein
MSIKLLLPLLALALFDVLGVVLGYEAIARLRRLHVPPFPPFEGLGVILLLVPAPPDWLVLFWDSILGRIILWIGCLLIPVTVGVIAFTKQHVFSAFIIMSAWTLGSGVVGLWLWFHATFNATVMQ